MLNNSFSSRDIQDEVNIALTNEEGASMDY